MLTAFPSKSTFLERRVQYYDGQHFHRKDVLDLSYRATDINGSHGEIKQDFQMAMRADVNA
jgi:hypothetical protein